MRFTDPLEITPARITSNMAPEPGVGEEAYNNATSYALGRRVIVGAPSNAVSISNSGLSAAANFTGWTAHKMSDGAKVVLTTTGVLPAGLALSTIYYAVNTTADAFNLAATPGGTPISTTTAGSGTHTAVNHVHRTFESLEAANSGNAPTLAVNLGVKWADVGPTNAWAWADLYKSTATSYPSPYVLEVTPGVRIDTIGMSGVVADTVLIESYDGVTLIYSETITLSDRFVSDWKQYFYNAFMQRLDLARFNLPLTTNMKVKLTFTRALGLVSVGGVVFGQNQYVGATLAKPTDGAKNYSRVTTDDYGETQFVPRVSKQRFVGNILVDKANWPNVRALRQQLSAKPFLISGLDDDGDEYFTATNFIGFYSNMEGALDEPGPGLVMLALDAQEI